MKLAANAMLQTALTTKLDALPTAGKRAAQVTHNLAAARDEEDLLIEKYGQAQLEYDATPRGQAALRAMREHPAVAPEDREDVDERLHMAKVRREWQRRVSKQLQAMKRAHGEEAAAIWAYTELQQAAIRFDEISAELLARDANLAIPATTGGSGGKKAALGKQSIGVRGNPKRIRAKGTMLQRATRGLMRQRFLYALIIGDLDKYLVTTFHPDRLFKMGIANLQRRFI